MCVYVCFGGHFKARLLLKHGADVKMQDTDGLSALHYAVNCEFEDVARVLLEAKADPHNVSIYLSLPISYVTCFLSEWFQYNIILCISCYGRGYHIG